MDLDVRAKIFHSHILCFAIVPTPPYRPFSASMVAAFMYKFVFIEDESPTQDAKEVKDADEPYVPGP